MMRFLAALFVTACFVLSLSAHANDNDALLAIDATWNTLRLKPGVEGLDRLLADDWLLTHSDGRVQTKADAHGAGQDWAGVLLILPLPLARHPREGPDPRMLESGAGTQRLCFWHSSPKP